MIGCLFVPCWPHLAVEIFGGQLTSTLEGLADHFYRAYEHFEGNSLVFLLFDEENCKDEEYFDRSGNPI